MPPIDQLGTERIFCDNCDASGRRSLLFPAPDGWFYIATTVDADQTLYVYACGAACRDKLWQAGPGPALPGVAAHVGAAIRAHSAAPPTLASTPIPTPRACIFDEGVCKAANCPTHGWSKDP